MEDYALIISLALYGAYVATVARRPAEDGRASRILVGLLAAIFFYTALKYSLTELGIQPR